MQTKEKKSRKSQVWRSIILALVVVETIILLIVFVWDDYSFSSKKAAGSFGDRECIHTDEYDVYYYTISAEEEYASIDGFCAVKKMGFLYNEVEAEGREVYYNDEYVGLLYSLEGKECYYNIFRPVLYIGTDRDVESVNKLELCDKVIIDGEEISVDLNSYFVTDDNVDTFTMNGLELTLKEK